MSKSRLVLHDDIRLFRAAINFTSAETSFSANLIEKDYYCSVALLTLCSSLETEIAFKGGTCLSKVHGDFFRLSEDLDFSLSNPTHSSRTKRSKRIENFRKRFSSIPANTPCLRIIEELRGYNSSNQYCGRLAYTSSVTGRDEFIKIEVSVREPIIEPTVQVLTNTVLLDPFRKEAAVAPFLVHCLSI